MDMLSFPCSCDASVVITQTRPWNATLSAISGSTLPPKNVCSVPFPVKDTFVPTSSRD